MYETYNQTDLFLIMYQRSLYKKTQNKDIFFVFQRIIKKFLQNEATTKSFS